MTTGEFSPDLFTDLTRFAIENRVGGVIPFISARSSAKTAHRIFAFLQKYRTASAKYRDYRPWHGQCSTRQQRLSHKNARSSRGVPETGRSLEPPLC